MAHLNLALLGPLQITLGGDPLTTFRSDKEQALLAYLALESDRPHRREALAGLLWGDLPEDSALNNLRKVLHHLRQLLGEEESRAPFLIVTAKTIQFNQQSDSALDVATFEQAWTLAQGHHHRRSETCQPCRAWLETASSLYRGELLQGFNLPDAIGFDEWLLVRREHLRQQALTAFQRLTESYERRGDLEKALFAARQQVALEPWREAAHRQLMMVLAHSGQRAAALVQYEICRKALQTELGVEPESATVALYNQIKRGLDWETARPRLSNLPLPTTPFFGREKELARLDERLRDPAERLLTLVAVGGMGKTRLALKAAERVAEDFVDGVWFVPLAGVGGTPVESGEAEAALVRAIAAHLQITLASGSDPRSQVLSFLQTKECLLVLDNVEHLLEGAGLVLDILREAPSVTILITTRERLNLQAERLIFLDGLALPPAGENIEAASYSAVQLFLERAERSAGPLPLVAETKRAVISICWMLDGLPLGIELAAALVRVTPPVELAQTIRGNIETLATTMRDLPPRHRSLKAVFEQSWSLLNARERQVLAKTSSFVGGFNTSAAQAVAQAQPGELTVLVEKSLLRQVAADRFDMHELWRQFAADKLVALGESNTPQQHALYYLQQVAASEPALLGPEPQIPLGILRLEVDNIRQAWRVAVASEDAATLISALESLSLFYDYEGLFGDAERELGLAVERLQANGQHPQAVAQLQAAWAQFLRRLDQHASAIAAAEAAAQWAHAHAQPAIEARARLQGGLAYWQYSDYDSAHHQLAAAHTLAHQSDLPNVEARALRALGTILDLRGQYTQARPYFEQSLAIFIQTGNRQGECEALHSLGNAAWSQGDLLLSKSYHARCLEIAQATGNKLDESDALHNLGNALQTLGQYDAAADFFERAIKVTLESGLPPSAGSLSWSNFALVLRHLGQHELSVDYGERALALAREGNLRREEALALTCLGHAWFALQQPQTARDHYQSALDLNLALQQFNLSMESRAGLARCAVALNDLPAALAQVEAILAHLATGDLEGADEPFWVYLTAYQILKRVGDSRAGSLLQTAQSHLLALADKIDQPQARATYLESNSIHRDLLALAPIVRA